MSKTKKKHFIQKYPIVPVIFFFLFAWGWLLLISFFKPHLYIDKTAKLEYFDKKNKRHYRITNDSIIVNHNKKLKIMSITKKKTHQLITAKQADTRVYKFLIIDKKIYELKQFAL